MLAYRRTIGGVGPIVFEYQCVRLELRVDPHACSGRTVRKTAHRGGLVCVYCSETAHLRFWEMENGTWGRRLTLKFVYLSIIELVFSAVVVVVVVVIHLMPI